MLRGLVTAVRTLTIIPVPGPEAQDMSRALPWFPLVGALLGYLLWGLAEIFGTLSGPWPEGSALVVVAGSALLTRGLHLDGLADWADGFGGGRDRERMLAIMKDSHIGAFGVAAMVIILLAKWTACVRLAETGTLSWLITAYITSRFAMAELAVCLPYARSEGGTGRPFVTSARSSDRFQALGAAGLLVIIVSGAAGLVMLACGWGICRLLGGWFNRRVGGVTGDLLGACCELTEAGVLILCAAVGSELAGLLPWRLLTF